MGMTLHDNQYVAIISHGAAADAFVQQLCASEPALRWVRSVTKAYPEEAITWLAQLQPQSQLGAVMYVMEEAGAAEQALLSQQKMALQGTEVPVLAVLLEPVQGGVEVAGRVAALRAQCDGVLVLREPSLPDDISPFAQFLQLEVALRTALSVDTTINMCVEDIVACMAGMQSYIQVKSNDKGLHAWLAELIDQCNAISTPVHALGVFTEVSRCKPLTTARTMKQILLDGLPDSAASQICTWFPEVSGKAPRSFVIASF